MGGGRMLGSPITHNPLLSGLLHPPHPFILLPPQSSRKSTTAGGTPELGGMGSNTLQNKPHCPDPPEVELRHH